MPKKIVLKATGAEQYDGKVADAAMLPGDLVKRTSTGVIRHATAGGAAVPMFADNSAAQNRGIDSEYAIGEDVPVVIAQRGCQIYALLAANAAAVALGDRVESAGDGTVRKASGATRAKVTIGAGNAAVEFEAVASGDEGNAITVQYLTATAATATVTVSGNAIVIKPNSTTPGTTDLASTVVTLVNGSAEASALVVARNPGTGGSAVVSPVAATNLAGGADAGENAIGLAVEAVDNSAVATKARLRIEIL